MREMFGDLWEAHQLGNWVVITTNGDVRKDGACVMGRGVALQAAQRFPELPYDLGTELRDPRWAPGRANCVHAFLRYKIITFPVKHHWREPANLALIERSARELEALHISHADGGEVYPIYMVRPGCGNGKLRWPVVKRRIASILSDRFIVVERA